MNNISLQMTAAAALKTTTNKSEANNDKSVTTEPSAFNTMLSNQLQNQAQAKQLQDRQSQDRKSIDKLSQERQLQNKQLQDKQLQDKQLQGQQVADKPLPGQQDLAPPTAVKADIAPTAQKSTVSASTAAATAASETKNAEPSTTLIALADKAAVVTAKNAQAESAPADDAALVAAPAVNHVAQTNAANLMAAFNLAVVNPQAQAQQAEAAGFRQKNMDNVLTQALTQGKAGAAADQDVAQMTLEAKGVAQKMNWLDGMLPTATRQAAGEELMQTKAQQAGVQHNLAQPAIAQLASAQQDSLQQNNLQHSAIQQNLAQQTVVATSLPQALPATAMSGPALAAAQAASSNYISASPGKSGWDQAISQKVMWMAGEGGVQSATLTLNPPDLGPLQVVIHVNNDMVEANFMSDNADVRQALQDGLANLRDKMHEAGIQLGQTNVSAGGQAQQEFQQAQQERRAERMHGGDAMLAADNGVARPLQVRTDHGLVDTFA